MPKNNNDRGYELSYEWYASIRDNISRNSAKKITDSAIAKESGFYQSVFSDWKKGTSTPDAINTYKIAKYLGVSVEYLITRGNKSHSTILDKVAQNRELVEYVEMLFYLPPE